MVWLPVAMKWARPRFDLVVVDEAQDMNLPQLTMASKAVREGGRVCVVGDDRQAIYAFRGAVSDGIALMIQQLNAQVLPLTTTYRCPKKIVGLAATIVQDYRAADVAPEGILRDSSTEGMLAEVEAGDAILSRKNAPLMGLCLQLLRNGIPARIEGRDIGAMLCKIVEKLKSRSVPDLLRKLAAWSQRQTKRATISGSEAQVQSIEDQYLTLVAVAEGAASVREVTERLRDLFKDSKEGEVFSVTLSTVHKAKGLEWDRVFVLEDTFRKDDGGGEESNIRYVAYTRAKRELVLTGD
jgi:DNA helicase-2/ATP-dependent DNA helicase PcrA